MTCLWNSRKIKNIEYLCLQYWSKLKTFFNVKLTTWTSRQPAGSRSTRPGHEPCSTVCKATSWRLLRTSRGTEYLGPVIGGPVWRNRWISHITLSQHRHSRACCLAVLTLVPFLLISHTTYKRRKKEKILRA